MICHLDVIKLSSISKTCHDLESYLKTYQNGFLTWRCTFLITENKITRLIWTKICTTVENNPEKDWSMCISCLHKKMQQCYLRLEKLCICIGYGFCFTAVFLMVIAYIKRYLHQLKHYLHVTFYHLQTSVPSKANQQFCVY